MYCHFCYLSYHQQPVLPVGEIQRPLVYLHYQPVKLYQAIVCHQKRQAQYYGILVKQLTMKTSLSHPVYQRVILVCLEG